MPPGRYKGCTRGVFGLRSWNVDVRIPAAFSEKIDTEREDSSVSSKLEPQPTSKPKPPDVEVTFVSGQIILAKYSYKANKDSPLGTELSVNQGDKVVFVSVHPSNSHWVLAQAEEGEGYLPTKYLMPAKDKITSLPWLKNAPPQEQVESVYQPYQSAYNKQGSSSNEPAASTKYACDVCGKDFNGPHPYSSHMNSKAHREEVEAQSAYN